MYTELKLNQVGLELDSAKPTDLLGGFTLTRTAANLKLALSKMIWSDNPDSDATTLVDFHNGYLVDYQSATSSLSN